MTDAIEGAPKKPERLDVRLERGAVELEEVVAIARLLSNHLDDLHRDKEVDGNLTPNRIEVCEGAEPRLLANSAAFRAQKAYVAPEVWGEPATPTSDQFSMAAILYEALCGGRAFPGDDSDKIRVSITTGNRVPLAARVPGLADAVDGVFEKALAFDPEERFQSCSAFADALVAAIEKSQKAEGVLVQKPASNRPSSRRNKMISLSYELDDEAPPPINWMKVIGGLLLLMLVAAAVAVLSK